MTRRSFFRILGGLVLAALGFFAGRRVEEASWRAGVIAKTEMVAAVNAAEKGLLDHYPVPPPWHPNCRCVLKEPVTWYYVYTTPGQGPIILPKLKETPLPDGWRFEGAFHNDASRDTVGFVRPGKFPEWIEFEGRIS